MHNFPAWRHFNNIIGNPVFLGRFWHKKSAKNQGNKSQFFNLQKSLKNCAQKINKKRSVLAWLSIVVNLQTHTHIGPPPVDRPAMLLYGGAHAAHTSRGKKRRRWESVGGRETVEMRWMNERCEREVSEEGKDTHGRAVLVGKRRQTTFSSQPCTDGTVSRYTGPEVTWCH